VTTKFQSKVYHVCSKIPKGKVSTYKEIASALDTKAYQAVGTALNKNPFAPKVPCHRVVSTNGDLGGFAHGPKEKIKLLEKEGIKIRKNKVLNFKEIVHKF